MTFDEAVEAVRLLREANDRLNEYREYVTEKDQWRSAVSDVALLDALDTDFGDEGDDYRLTKSPDEVMAAMLEANQSAFIEGWEFFGEDVVDRVDKLGLLEEVEAD